ncbi:MAG: hypothetical protein ACLS6O_02040 [Bifidobacterium sp.]
MSANLLGLPKEWTIKNYINVRDGPGVPPLLNTLIVTFFAVVIQVPSAPWPHTHNLRPFTAAVGAILMVVRRRRRRRRSCTAWRRTRTWSTLRRTGDYLPGGGVLLLLIGTCAAAVELIEAYARRRASCASSGRS